MTVKELIEKLSLEDQSLRVVVNGYESGYDEIESVNLIEIAPNPHVGEKDWEGEWDDAYLRPSSTKKETAILLPRKS